VTVPSLINIENPEGEGEIEQSMSPTYPTAIFNFTVESGKLENEEKNT
jgi:hypothetical protein